MGTQTSENFRVDLKGMVDLLSQRILREALPRLADGGFADEQRQAAASLVSALEQDDREAEAQQVWEAWGVTPPSD